VGARHRCLGFATEDPASDAPSPLRCSRPEWLDPASHSAALRRGGATGQRRLSTSATNLRSTSTTAGSSEPRAPHPRLPASAAVFRTAPLSKSGRIAGGRARGTASRDVTGQGPARGRIRPPCSAPPAAIARGESFTPTRSARTPPVASSWRRRLEEPMPPSARHFERPLTNPPGKPRVSAEPAF
jgi:hypothetical protein